MNGLLRALWATLALGALAGQVMAQDASVNQASVTDPAVRMEFTNPGLSPPHWILTLHPDGSGHFWSEAGKMLAGDPQDIKEPEQDRNFQVNPAFAAQVFGAAREHRWFTVP